MTIPLWTICFLLGSRFSSAFSPRISTPSAVRGPRSHRTIHFDRRRHGDVEEERWSTPSHENKRMRETHQDRSQGSSARGSRQNFDKGLPSQWQQHEERPRRSDHDTVTALKQHIAQSQQAEITDKNAHFFSQKSLKDLSLHMTTPTNDEADHDDVFLPLCQAAGISRPSKIQSLAWPLISSGKSTLVADQTGSGKTLAYLLPLLQRALSGPKIKTPGTPRVSSTDCRISRSDP